MSMMSHNAQVRVPLKAALTRGTLNLSYESNIAGHVVGITRLEGLMTSQVRILACYITRNLSRTPRRVFV